jgi:hypothetical protein
VTSAIEEVSAPLVGIVQSRDLREVSIVQAEVAIPKHLQYGIPGKKTKDAQGNWTQGPQKVGLTADGYDHVNRVMGVQLITPRFVHDENGTEVLNPIHRKDYIYLRLVGVWWNDLGQMVAYGEDIEVDFQRIYQEARLNATWYEAEEGKKYDTRRTADLRIARDEDGIPIMDAEGLPKHTVVIPDSEELKALQKLYSLRTFGLRYAYTVAKTRILKVASGIRTLPVDAPKNVKVKVFGFRDNLTPEQRAAKAQQDQTAIFGKAITAGDPVQALTDDEMQSVAVDEPEPETIMGEQATEPSEQPSGLCGAKAPDDESVECHAEAGHSGAHQDAAGENIWPNT